MPIPPLLRGVVDNLPGDYSAVLVRSEFEGLTNSEIAEVIGTSLDTAKIRLYRARTKLRKALECIFISAISLLSMEVSYEAEGQNNHC